MSVLEQVLSSALSVTIKNRTNATRGQREYELSAVDERFRYGEAISIPWNYSMVAERNSHSVSRVNRFYCSW
jgi:hypothetical protein